MAGTAVFMGDPKQSEQRLKPENLPERLYKVSGRIFSPRLAERN